nr:retrovirus-related Pol polyprotein from transposon TNT 1-94 [Tanacetum cinerariifolium]
MLTSFDREDLEDLYKLVKAKYGSTRPVKDLDLLLWGDLKTMFEPHVEDVVCRKQLGYKVLEWKLYDSYGVHSLRMQSMQDQHDMFTKALPEDRFQYLVRRIGMRCLTPVELEVLANEFDCPLEEVEDDLDHHDVSYETDPMLHEIRHRFHVAWIHPKLLRELHDPDRHNLLGYDLLCFVVMEVVVVEVLLLLLRFLMYKERIRTDNGTEFKNKTLAKFFDEVGITQQFSAARTPQQNGVMERRNRTLVEAARTMLTFANLPSFLWAEAIATACFTQNRLIIHKRFDKTPYELMNKRKPNIKFFRVFRCRCYLLNDYEDVGKLKAKEILECFLEPSLSNLNEREKTSNPSVSKVSKASKKYLKDLFQDFYDEYFDSSNIIKSSTTNVETSINEEVFHEVSESFQGESSSSSLNDDVQQSL